MKAYKILESACLLVCGSPAGETLQKAGVGLINTILEDLYKEPITSLSDDIPTHEKGILTALESGVGMLICVMLGDDAGLSRMTEIYNSKRNRIIGKVTKIRDSVFGGGNN